MMREYIRILRPEQWTKNFFIFLPLFFARHLHEPKHLLAVTLAFLVFCLVTSAVYIFNDIIDVEEDRGHPKKKLRPLPAGTVGLRAAITMMAVLAVAGTVAAWFLSPQMAYLCVLYMAMNVAYSIRLKHVPILDVVVVAAGFVIRIFIGGVVGGVHLSMWIVIMTFLLALFLALGKRRDDVRIFIETNHRPRKSVDGYNLRFVDASMMIMAAVVIVAYLMYTISPGVAEQYETDKLYMTGIFVLMGVMRYLQITQVEEAGGNPTEVFLKDRFIQVTVACWIIATGLLVYF